MVLNTVLCILFNPLDEMVETDNLKGFRAKFSIGKKPQ
jgi:hypothetical protein